jgi:hypothetical protein
MFSFFVEDMWFDSQQEKNFSLLHSVQTGSVVYSASSLMGTGGSESGIKRQGREANQSPPCSVEVKNGGAIFPLPHMSSGHSA